MVVVVRRWAPGLLANGRGLELAGWVRTSLSCSTGSEYVATFSSYASYYPYPDEGVLCNPNVGVGALAASGVSCLVSGARKKLKVRNPELGECASFKAFRILGVHETAFRRAPNFCHGFYDRKRITCREPRAPTIALTLRGLVQVTSCCHRLPKYVAGIHAYDIPLSGDLRQESIQAGFGCSTIIKLHGKKGLSANVGPRKTPRW